MAVQLVRYELSHGGAVLFEVSEDTIGYQPAGRGEDGIVQAGESLEAALRQVLPTARVLVDTLSQLKASSVTVEFGIKLSGEANVVVAKTSVEGHFTVQLAFQSTASDSPTR